MSSVIVVRHGRSTSNAAKTLAGRTPGVDLDEVGRAQATALGQRLVGVRLQAVVCSPLERCQQTAQAVLEAASSSIEISTDDRVQETDYGQWSGRLLADLSREPEWVTVQTTPSAAQFPGGEKMTAVVDRVVAAVQDWNARLPEDAVWLLVSHGDVISGLLTWALGMDYDRVQSLMIDPASASVIHLASPSAEPGTSAALTRVACVNSLAGPLAGFVCRPAPHEGQVGGGLGSAAGEPRLEQPVGGMPDEAEGPASTVGP